MQYMSKSMPKPPKGMSFEGVENQLVPDQNMSLQDILRRFTRGEPLPVGNEVNFSSDVDSVLAVDVEKMGYADLTDKAEFSRQLQVVREEYDRQMKEKKRVEHDKAVAEAKKAEEKRIRLKAKALAKKLPPSA